MIEDVCKTYKVVKDSLDLRFDTVRTQDMLKIKDLKACELDVLNNLDWDLNNITPIHFTLNFAYQGIVFTNDMLHQN